MRKTTFHALLSAGILLFPLAAPAAGLGKLTVLSAPGAPLQAQIDLTGVSFDEVARLKARLADEHAYEQAHLRYQPALKTLSLSVLAGADGAPFLKLSSSQPINVQDLNVLIELDSSNGAQEFTVALDQSGAAAIPVNIASAVAPGQGGAPAQAEPPAPANRQAPREKGAKVKVKSGDTLYGIARPRLAPGQSMSQLVVAIYQANPQGFSQKNMNRLLAGRVLNMPSKAAVAAIEPGEALRIIRAQQQSWHGYQQQVAEHAAMQGGAANAGATQQASGKIQASTRDQGATAKAAPEDVLRLSRGASPADGAAADALGKKERAATRQEEKIAKDKNLQEADDRINALKKNIGEMNQLLAVKDPNLAHMQQQAAQAVKPKAAEKKPVEKKPAGTSAPVAAPAEARQGTRRTAALAALGVAVLSLLAVVAMLMRRRRDNEPVPAATAEQESTASAAPEARPAEPAPVTETPPAVMPQDPLMVAELYLAQQRIDQAEELLTNALTQDASRTDIQIKLLELHAMRGNTAAYEALARQYQANHAGRKAEEWRQICAQGREIDPQNPLYATVGDAAPGADDVFAAAPAVTGLVLETPLGEAVAAPALVDAGDDGMAPRALDTADAPDAAPAEAALAFSLDEIPSFTEAVAEAQAPAAAPAEAAKTDVPAGGSIDLDLDFRLDAAADGGTAVAEPEVAVQQSPAAAADFSAISLDLNVPMAADVADTAILEQSLAAVTVDAGEIATKLDLARAYIEMGDVTGAREILEEVLTEAEGEQLAEARMLWEKSR